MTDQPRCQTCYKPHPWSDGTEPKHPFNDGSNPRMQFSAKKHQDEAQTPPPVSHVPPAWPFDPVLRQALIDKGVLTVSDLRDAEDKIRSTTGLMLGGERGQSTT